MPDDEKWPTFPKPFLPLAVANAEGLQPYVTGMQLEPGWEVIGVDVDTGAGDPVPFQPFDPHRPKMPSVIGMRE